MDVALKNPTGRKFAGYSTLDLKCAVVDFQMGLDPNQKYMTAEQVAAQIAAMTLEVARREAGLSKTIHELMGR